MRIIKEDINEKPYRSPILDAYFRGRRILTADIETTGFSAVKNHFVLGGACILKENTMKVVQIFADNREEEAQALAKYRDLLLQSEVIITFNGSAFDIPFLKKRMDLLGVPGSEDLDSLYHVDLLKIIRKYTNLKDLLPDLKQRTVEDFYGVSQLRRDEIDGGESIRLYNKYVKLTADSEPAADGCPVLTDEAELLLKMILLHNRDDVVRLTDLVRMTRQMDMHRILFFEGWPGVSGIQLEPGFMRIKGDREIAIDTESVGGFTVTDLAASGLDIPELRKLPGYESGYLILGNRQGINYLEVNSLAIGAERGIRNFYGKSKEAGLK